MGAVLKQQKSREVNAILVCSRWRAEKRKKEEKIRNSRDRAMPGTSTSTGVKAGALAEWGC